MTRGMILAIVALALSLSCGSNTTTYPNAPVILISIDTLRSDHLPAYGYTAIETPGLDMLAADGVVYDRAYAHYPLTLPSHASLLTGLIPPNIGVRNNAGFLLEDRFETLPEILQEQGYTTGGVISSMVLKQSTGMAQGFQFFDDALQVNDGNHIRMYAQRRGDASVSSAQQWLSQQGDDPYFLFLHLYDPHTPYSPPEPFASRYDSPYDGEIAYTDSLLTTFFDDLKARGLYNDALIIVLSDHGEGLGDHGEEEHGVLLYRESIQVPLIVKFPNNDRAGTRVPEPVALVDVMPSLLNSLDIHAPQSDGVDIFNKRPPTGRLIFSETLYPYYQFGWCSSKSVIKDTLHYIEICEPELYDLVEDPNQRNDLYGKEAVPSDMVSMLDEIGEGLATTADTSQQDLELLASLGYGDNTVGVDQSNILDPKTQLAIFKELDKAKVMLQEQRYADAEAFLVPILTQNPALNDGRYLLIQALVEQDKLKTAETVCLDGLGMFPDNLNYLISLTTIKFRLDKDEEAVRAAKSAFALDMDTAGAQLLMPLYDHDKQALAVNYAHSILEKFTATALSAPYANLILGRHLRDQENHVAAVPYLENALAVIDNIRLTQTKVQLYLALADSYGRLGKEAAAVTLVKQALDLEPAYSETNATLSYLYASLRDPTRAIAVMEQWLANFPTRANYLRAAEVVERMGMTSRGTRYREQANELPPE